MSGADDTAPPRPELSRLVTVARLPAQGRTVTIDADAAEREALAARFDLQAVVSLTAWVRVRPLGARRGITRAEVTGGFEARVVQTCVVSLAPFSGVVTDEVALRFSDEPAARPSADGAVEVNPLAADTSDGPEPLEGGIIDVGEVIAEAFGLALDPYPRTDGAALDGDWSDKAESGNAAPADGHTPDGHTPDGHSGPFAALTALKTGQRGD